MKIINNLTKKNFIPIGLLLIVLVSALSCFASVPKTKVIKILSNYGSSLKVVKNLDHVMVTEPQPAGNNRRPTFYANGVELEPLTVHLCGTFTTVSTPDGNSKRVYKKVDPKEIYKLSFVADPAETLLDEQYNPENTIPLIHNSSPSAKSYKVINNPDQGEPTNLTYEQAANRKILFLYDNTSNYYNLYTKMEGFHMGGVIGNSQMLSAHMRRTYADSNQCWNEDPGVGDTTVKLYLLATNQLQQTTDLPIYIVARADTPGYPTMHGAVVHYDIAKAPTLERNDINASKEVVSYHAVRHAGAFHSFYSAKIDTKTGLDNHAVREERGKYVCQYHAGAAFHNLFHYDDHQRNGGFNCKGMGAPKIGRYDCANISCSRWTVLTEISSRLRSTVIHDLFTSYAKEGATCPNHPSVSTQHAHVTFRPILKSAFPEAFYSKNPEQQLKYYVSYTGGVGAFFYPRNGSQNDNKEISTQSVGGNANTFYYWSYVTGDEPSPGQSCKWKGTAMLSGHDQYGNPIDMSVILANGQDSPQIN